MKRILVTGGYGAVGRAVFAAATQQDIEVEIHAGRCDGDLTDPATVRALVERVRPDVIVNAAGATYGDPDTLWSANLLIPLRLLDATRQVVPDARVVLVGSAAEYGLTEPGVLIREDRPCAPNSIYGQTKLAAGQMALSLQTPRVVVARLFNVVTSPHDPRSLLGRLAGEYAASEMDPQGAEAVRDFVALDDVGVALVALGLARVAPHMVNVCTGTARTAAEQLGHRSAREADLWAVGDPTSLAATTGLRLQPPDPESTLT